MALETRRAPSVASSADLLEALPAAVLVLDGSGRVRYANRSARSALRPVDPIGRSVDEVLGERLPSQGGDADERQVRALGPRGRRIGYSEAAVQGERVIVFRDISKLARLRQERDKLMGLAAIGEALPSLLHELKNPLAAVTTLVEVLVEDMPDDETRKDLYAILCELRRMKLSFEGFGAVQGELRSKRAQAVDLACREACRVLAARAEGVGVEFRQQIRDMPLLPLDPSMIRAILFNFVTNAIHACKRGDAVRVEVGLTRDGRQLEIVVSDIGAGMSPEVLERATELFFTTKPSGSGIGLALCRRAIEGAGGSLDLRSVPGFGTTLCARIPVEREEERWDESKP